MISLRFLIPMRNTVTPVKVKPIPFGIDNTSYQSHPFTSFNQPELCTTISFAAIKTKVRTFKALNDRITPSSEEDQFPVGLRPELMPRHVAVIADGNRRWAREKGLSASAGHEAGVILLGQLTELCCRWGIKVLTVFIFSCDNWSRSKVEINFMMSLFERLIFSESEVEKFSREDIRMSVIGDTSKLPKPLQGLINNAEETTKYNSGLQLILALNYSGKYDVMQACKTIAQKVKDGLIQLEDINENLIERKLETNCTEFPCPDLLIRTGGELRVSNFFLWQLAYTEFFIVQKCWPDFGEAEFVEALTSFQKRHRRYGGWYS